MTIVQSLKDLERRLAEAFLDGDNFCTPAPTPALALCLACVRALIAQGEK